ncbi:MAG: hypothetical protein K6B46_06795 [Opitutales bacterium]|nr:hypothetical protein [Opitutales bacterium]
MSDNTPENGVEENPTAVPASDATPTTAPEAVPAEETVEAPKAPLAENALESAHADALPLCPIGNEEKASPTTKKYNNNGHRGLHRGNKSNTKSGTPSSQPGLIDNNEGFKETLSGAGVNKARRQRPRTNENVINKNIEEARESGSWRVESAVKEPRKFHPQSNIVDSNGKLHIEPAAMPVQAKEPSLLSKLWTKVCKLFGVKTKKHGKKFDKKHNGKRYYKNDKKFNKGNFRHGGKNRNFRRRGKDFKANKD